MNWTKWGFGASALLALSACGEDPNAISTGSAKGDAIALFTKVNAMGTSCDTAMARVASALTGADTIALYRAANDADSICLPVGNDINNIPVPASFDDKAEKAARGALRSCQDAYVSKWSAASKIKEIVDGDSSVSARAELQDAIGSIETGNRLCAGGLVAVAAAQGATDQDLGLINDRPKAK